MVRKRTYLQLLSNIIKCSRWMVIASAIFVFLGALLFPVNIKLRQGIFDSILYDKPIKIFVMFLLPLMCIHIYDSLKEPLISLLKNKIEIRIREIYLREIVLKRARLTYSIYENEQKNDFFERIDSDIEIKLTEGMFNILDVISVVMIIIGTMVILSEAGIAFAFVAVFTAIPAQYIAYKGGIREYKEDSSLLKKKRKCDYFSKMISEKGAVKERELFNYVGYVNQLWGKKIKEYKYKLLKVKFLTAFKISTSGLVSDLYIGIVFIVLLFPLYYGRVSVGYYVSACMAVIAMSKRLSDSTDLMQEVSAYKELLCELRDFEDWDEVPVIRDKAQTFESMEFRHVTFRYPGTDKDIFKDFNLVIKKGKHYALVGENGEGKSTLIKLMLGFYRVQNGDILINGNSIYNMNYGELIGYYMVIFQDFARYSLSVKENIIIGDLNHKHETERFDFAIEESGLKSILSGYPSGSETRLGKIYEDGIDLSGGEWQKIAYARTLMSDAPIRILDEPASALDPVAERDLYNSFAKLCNGYTTILISHRLGSTILADSILVLRDGTVHESGTHEELIAKRGLYYRMFNTQKKWYAIGGEDG